MYPERRPQRARHPDVAPDNDAPCLERQGVSGFCSSSRSPGAARTVWIDGLQGRSTQIIDPWRHSQPASLAQAVRQHPPDFDAVPGGYLRHRTDKVDALPRNSHRAGPVACPSGYRCSNRSAHDRPARATRLQRLSRARPPGSVDMRISRHSPSNGHPQTARHLEAGHGNLPSGHAR